MEKLADGLQKLGEEDLLQVVQMVYDNKTQDTYTKNDVESMYIYHLEYPAAPRKDLLLSWMMSFLCFSADFLVMCSC